MEMTFLLQILLYLTLCLLWPAACLPRRPETKAVDRPMVEAYDAWGTTKSHNLSPLTKVVPSMPKDWDKAKSGLRPSSLSKYYFMADAKPEPTPAINPKEMPGTRPENMPLAKPQDMFRSMDGNSGPEESTMLKSSIKFQMAEKAMLDSSERQKMMQEKKDMVSSNVPGPQTPYTSAGKSPQTSMKRSSDDQMSKPEKKMKEKHSSKMPMKKPSAMPMAESNKTVDKFSRKKNMSKPKDMQLVKNKSWEKYSLMKDLNEKKKESPKFSLTQINKSNSVPVPESLAIAIPAIKSHAPADPLPKAKLETSDDISPKPSTKSPLTENKSTLKSSLPPKRQLQTDSLSKSDEKSPETALDKLSGFQNLPELANEDITLQKMKTEKLLTERLVKTDMLVKKLPSIDKFQQLQQAQKPKQLPQEPLKEDTQTFLYENKMARSVQTQPKPTQDKSPSWSTLQMPLSEKPEWQLHGLRTRREAQQRRSGQTKASGPGGRVPMYRMMKAMMGGDGKVAEQTRGNDVNQKKAGSKGSAMGPKLMQNMMGEDFRKISRIMDSKSGSQPMKEMTGKDFSKKMAYIMGDKMDPQKMKKMMGEDYSSKTREMMADKMGPQTMNEMMGKELNRSPDEMKEMMEKHLRKMLEKMVNEMGQKEMKEMMEKEFSGKVLSTSMGSETMKKIMGEEFSKKMIEMMHGKMDPAASKNKITLEKLDAMMSEMMGDKDKFEAMKVMMAEMMGDKEKFEAMKVMMDDKEKFEAMKVMMDDKEKFEAMKVMMDDKEKFETMKVMKAMMGDKEKSEAMKAMINSEPGLAKIKDLMAGNPGQETLEMFRKIGLAKMKEIMNSKKGKNISEVTSISKIHEKENSLKSEVKQKTSESVSDTDVKMEDNPILATQSLSQVTTSWKLTPLPDLDIKTEVTTVTTDPGLRQPDLEPGHKAGEDGIRKTADKNAPAKDKEKADLLVKKTRKMEWTSSTMTSRITSDDKRKAAVKEASVQNKFLTRFHWPSQVPGGLAGRDSFTGGFQEGEI